MDDTLKKDALDYHTRPPSGKLSVIATKPLVTQRDLSLAYSPGVAAACELIQENPSSVHTVTNRGRLVAVISNGTAVLGLGNIGPLAAKPVMEGKAVLFKKFADLDVFDLEVDASSVDHFCDVVTALAPTFGGINLEDIKAPECFEIERRLRERLDIPVMHDDQHGTAITVAAALYNGLEITERVFQDVKLVCSGAGAAALACLDMLVSMGLKRENVFVLDRRGVLYQGREGINAYAAPYARHTDARTLDEAIEGADVFLGLSGPKVLSPAMVKKMGPRPLIFALANPEPEIRPEEALAVRPDAILATGRSDYPNQVNNVLCFPFIFRAALDVGATDINNAMKVACAQAIARLARREHTEAVSEVYGEIPTFGPEYLIPKPFDHRLMLEVTPSVAQAAMDSKVASRPIEDMALYKEKLTAFVYRSGTTMKPVFDRAAKDPRRVVYCEGEERRVLRAVQTVVDEGLAFPILIGRRHVVETRIAQLGLRLERGKTFELCDPESDERYKDYWTLHHSLMGRRGFSQEGSKIVIRTETTAIGALMVRRGEADAMLCGTTGSFDIHLRHIQHLIGCHLSKLSAVTMLVLDQAVVFIANSHGVPNPSADELVEITLESAQVVKRFGLQPSVALLSYSSFGSSPFHGTPSKMREATEKLRQLDLDFELDGEMRVDVALDPELRRTLLKDSTLEGAANLLVMPNLDASNLVYGALKTLAKGIAIGPILIGARSPAHIVPTSATSRHLFNMTALAVVDAQLHKRTHG